MMRRFAVVYCVLLLSMGRVWAGPPYVTDDPEPTDYQHFEIYAFGSGSIARDGRDGEGGIDFNYGGAPNLQLTAVLPLAYDSPDGAAAMAGVGNIELAVKYKFLHQEDVGWDVSVFPRLFLPSLSSRIGDHHFSILLPVWIGRDFGTWSTFGGGGCAWNESRESQNYCLAGWALTRVIAPHLTVGAEVYHQTAADRGGKAATGVGFGVTYDLNEHYHLMASAGPGLQNRAETGDMAWYAAVLMTF
jgi:hypothetical protein